MLVKREAEIPGLRRRFPKIETSLQRLQYPSRRPVLELIGQLPGVYFQAHKSALDTVKTADRTFLFEHGDA